MGPIHLDWEGTPAARHVVRLAGGLLLWAVTVFGGWLLLEGVGEVVGVAGEGWFVLVQGVAVSLCVVLAFDVWQRRSRWMPVPVPGMGPVPGIPGRGRGRGGQLVAGFFLGAGLMSAIVVVVWGLGGLTLSVAPRPWEGVLWALGTALLLASAEEVLFRGILLRDVEVWTGTWIALVASSLLSGLVPLAAGQASLWSCLLYSLEVGSLLGALCILTEGIWAPIGFHLAWSLVQGGVFGGSVAGSDWSGVLVAHAAGPARISGGSAGIGGSLVTLLACVAVSATILATAHARGRFVSRRAYGHLSGSRRA